MTLQIKQCEILQSAVNHICCARLFSHLKPCWFFGGVIVRRTLKIALKKPPKNCLITRTSGSHTSTLGKIKSKADGSCLQIFSCLFVFSCISSMRETGGGEVSEGGKHHRAWDTITPAMEYEMFLYFIITGSLSGALTSERFLSWTVCRLNKIPPVLDSYREWTRCQLGQGLTLGAKLCGAKLNISAPQIVPICHHGSVLW